MASVGPQKDNKNMPETHFDINVMDFNELAVVLGA
jgi:hypothetical protein